MTRHVLSIALVAAAALALAACTSAPAASPSSSRSAATASPSPTATAVSKIDIAVRLVTQEGLAIALASNVLQTQLRLVQDVSDGPQGCQALTGGGSHQVTAANGADLTDVIFYDAGCAKPYMTATATVHTTDGGATATAKVDYTGTDGAALGSLTTDAHAEIGDSLTLEGLGTFTPAAPGAPVASLGLACPHSTETTLDCQGGIAQDFAALKTAIGSVTPLTLTIGSDQADQISFSGSGTSTATAPLGALTIVSPDGANLAIQGASAATSGIQTSGQAHGFVLFPPTPTGWTVTDAADDVIFSLNLDDDTSRTLTGTVTRISTKAPLAALKLDQSGTGTVAYGTQAPVPVVSWILTR